MTTSVKRGRNEADALATGQKCEPGKGQLRDRMCNEVRHIKRNASVGAGECDGCRGRFGEASRVSAATSKREIMPESLEYDLEQILR